MKKSTPTIEVQALIMAYVEHNNGCNFQRMLEELRIKKSSYDHAQKMLAGKIESVGQGISRRIFLAGSELSDVDRRAREHKRHYNAARYIRQRLDVATPGLQMPQTQFETCWRPVPVFRSMELVA